MKNIGNIATSILSIAFIFFYVSGSIHSCNKHKNDAEIERYSPFAVYRGLEMFWHNDFAGVDWKEKINEDINTSVKLLTAVTQTYDLVNTKQQISEFSKQLTEYPKEKRKEIANAVRRFLEFGNLWTKDMIRNLENPDSSTHFKFSTQLQQAYDSLMNYYYIAEMGDFKILSDSLVNDMTKYPDNRQMYIDRLKGHHVADNSQYKMYFQKMFDEPL